MNQWIKDHTPWLLCVLECGSLLLAVWMESVYLTATAAAGLWLTLLRLRYVALLAKEETVQQKKGKLSGLWLLLTSISVILVSAIQPFLQTERSSTLLEMIAVCGMTGVITGLVIWAVIDQRKEKNTVVSILRHYDFSLLALCLSILVSQLLWLSGEDTWAAMVCLTGCVMGAVILLLGCDLLLRASCGYLSTLESIRTVKQLFKEKRRMFHFAKVGKDGFLVLFKLAMSMVSHSFFLFSNALFSCGMGVARLVALQMKKKDPPGQFRLYRNVGVILALAGLAYVTYSIRLFFGGTPGNYGQIMGIAIAFYTFLEFGLQIADLIRLRKQHNLEAEAMRLISFCSILVSFVLTQSALMSSSSPGNHAITDGMAGVFFGSLVMLVGIIMLLRHRKIKQETISAQC